MKAKTEEYAFHQMNDLQWRLGLLEQSHSITITNSEYHRWIKDLSSKNYIVVWETTDAEGDHFQVWGREVEVDVDA